MLDIAFIFQTFNERFYEKTAALARRMGETFVNFAHGALSESDGRNKTSSCNTDAFVWGPEGKEVRVLPVEYDAQFHNGSAELITKLGVDKCIKALELFQFGRRY